MLYKLGHENKVLGYLQYKDGKLSGKFFNHGIKHTISAMMKNMSAEQVIEHLPQVFVGDLWFRPMYSSVDSFTEVS